jgi:hypothetical protein
MKLPLLIFLVLLIACRLSLAGQDERFVEFPDIGGGGKPSYTIYVLFKLYNPADLRLSVRG